MNYRILLENLTEEIKKLRIELNGALKFNNTSEIARLSKLLTYKNSKVSDVVMDILEKQRYADTNTTVSSTVTADINIPEDSATNLYSIRRDRGE